MAAKTKKNNALKKQLYGTQFPLPCLQQQQQLKAQSQQKSTQCWGQQGSLSDCINYILSSFSLGKTNDTLELNLIHAEFHPQGQCVWVTKREDMSTLFRQGFFGKGTLSRSEPTWKERNTTSAQGGISLEEITRQRRIERAQLKQKKAQQGQATVSITSIGSSVSSSGTSNPDTSASPPQAGLTSSSNQPNSTSTVAPLETYKNVTHILDEDENYEHLQLSLEEAFFLVFGVECIYVTDAAAVASMPNMSIQDCWLRFAEASTLQQAQLISQHSTTSQLSSSSFEISANNPFIVRYVVYHYYRSQGWIVKDGLKYGTDFLLYQRGLVFGHSQYAVRVIPHSSQDKVNMGSEFISQHKSTFKHASISPTPGLCSEHQALSWQWLLTLNRVIAQVQK
ncbi:tRNA splicing endonuclease subunit sen2, partial [Mortierella sp. AM989]